MTAALAAALIAPPAYGQLNGTPNRVVKFVSPTTGGNSQLFDNGTNVGIGTTNPQDVLHLFRANPPRATVGVLMGNSSTGPGRRGFLVDYHSTGGAELWNFENTSMWFGTSNTRRMTIGANGDVFMDGSTFFLDASANRVGIGTETPQDVLHLFRGGAAATVGVLMGNSLVPAGRRGFLVDFHRTGGAELWNFENSDMWFGTNDARRMTITRDGRVGIGGLPASVVFGNTTFRPLVDIHGDLRLQNVPVWDGPNEHDLTWGAGFADGVAFQPPKLLISREGSSRRYKAEIQPAEEDFSKILTVQPMKYQMREGYGLPGVWLFGYIAEDLHEAGLRNLVIYDQEGRPDGVSYKKVALYVNEVVKSQQRTIEQLQGEVAALRTRLHEIENLLKRQAGSTGAG